MDGYIVGSMISANSITGEQIQANSIKTANLELSVQKKIQDATNEETVKALIKADLDGFESTLSKEFVTVENATTQIQQATEVAVKEATQNIIDNAVSESMGAVDGQLNDKLNQYTSGKESSISRCMSYCHRNHGWFPEHNPCCRAGRNRNQGGIEQSRCEA